MLEYLLALLNVFGSGILSINYFTKILIIYKTVIKQMKLMNSYFINPHKEFQISFCPFKSHFNSLYIDILPLLKTVG